MIYETKIKKKVILDKERRKMKDDLAPKANITVKNDKVKKWE